jgi:hypothetical protein
MQELIELHPTPPRPQLKWWPVLGAFLLALGGYFGAWIWHEAAGLVITGVDLAEYVKFLPPFRAGRITILRESFYAPLACGSLIASLLASRRALPLWLRGLAGVGAISLALAMLPPAWSPAVVGLPEFRIQVAVMAACIAALPLLLVTRFLPDGVILIVVALLALIGAIWPTSSFLPLLEPIGTLYASAQHPGWGFWLCTLGFHLTAFFSVLGTMPRRPLRKLPL